MSSLSTPMRPWAWLNLRIDCCRRAPVTPSLVPSPAYIVRPNLPTPSEPHGLNFKLCMFTLSSIDWLSDWFYSPLYWFPCSFIHLKCPTCWRWEDAYGCGEYPTCWRWQDAYGCGGGNDNSSGCSSAFKSEKSEVLSTSSAINHSYIIRSSLTHDLEIPLTQDHSDWDDGRCWLTFLSWLPLLP
jgi:hypothetical protein